MRRVVRTGQYHPPSVGRAEPREEGWMVGRVGVRIALAVEQQGGHVHPDGIDGLELPLVLPVGVATRT